VPETPVDSTADLLPSAAETSSLVVPATDDLGSTTLLPGVIDEILAGGDPVAGLLPIAAVAGMAVAVTAAIGRGASSSATSLAVTNVRLLPSVVGASLDRAGTAMSDVATKLDSAGTAVAHPIREGFDRAVSRPVFSEDSEGLRDARLLAQLGIVLGTIYVAFLTVWFWATRLRWNPRA
jgi:hypothetical protein